LNILFIGDVVGKVGREAVSKLLPDLVNRYSIDFVIANAENAAGGFGLTAKVATQLFQAGIDVLTSGNHIWNKREIIELLSTEERILRPINYPPQAPGRGSIVLFGKKDVLVGVINASGRVFMEALDCPFRSLQNELRNLKEKAKIIIVDIHAEATSEKVAVGVYLDGKVSAVIGTHTHVQTADERILPKGTAYITDVGMTGPSDSIIGVKKDHILRRFFTQIPVRLEVAKGGAIFSGVVLTVEEESGIATRIDRIQLQLN
jgi:hypothetical protein